MEMTDGATWRAAAITVTTPSGSSGSSAATRFGTPPVMRRALVMSGSRPSSPGTAETSWLRSATSDVWSMNASKGWASWSISMQSSSTTTITCGISSA